MSLIVLTSHLNSLKFIIHLFIEIHFTFRPTIKQLIGHPFFEDPGFTLELVNRDAVIEMRESMATFRLRFTDQRKQGPSREAIGKHKEGEAIEFNFNLESDNTVEVTSSMVRFAC